MGRGLSNAVRQDLVLDLPSWFESQSYSREAAPVLRSDYVNPLRKPLFLSVNYRVGA